MQKTKKRRAGRPSVFDGFRVQVYLDKMSVETAKRLGEGNASAGIRIALEQASKVSLAKPLPRPDGAQRTRHN